MATHSSILAWRIPWTEEPGGGHKELNTAVTNTFIQTFPVPGFHPWYHMICSHQDSLTFLVLDSFLDFSFFNDLDRRKSLCGAHTSGEGL